MATGRLWLILALVLMLLATGCCHRRWCCRHPCSRWCNPAPCCYEAPPCCAPPAPCPPCGAACGGECGGF
jgi:hypothetical protein